MILHQQFLGGFFFANLKGGSRVLQPGNPHLKAKVLRHLMDVFHLVGVVRHPRQIDQRELRSFAPYNLNEDRIAGDESVSRRVYLYFH